MGFSKTLFRKIGGNNFFKYIEINLKYTQTCTHTCSWKDPESVIVKAVKSDFIQELL